MKILILSRNLETSFIRFTINNFFSKNESSFENSSSFGVKYMMTLEEKISLMIYVKKSVNCMINFNFKSKYERIDDERTFTFHSDDRFLAMMSQE